jgi:hypothetical protein
VKLLSRLSLSGLLCSVLLSAQTPYGSLTGRITNSSGALVPGASLIATNTETNVRTTTITNAAGVFDVPNLTPGRYRINVQLSAFKSYERGTLEVRVCDRYLSTS